MNSNSHIHLIGGTGRIGRKLLNSLEAQPINKFSNIWIYCDGNKSFQYNNEQIYHRSVNSIKYKNYSAFKLSDLIKENDINREDQHIVINLRGVNNRIDWTSRPLDSMEVQSQSIKNIIESDIYMFKNTKLIHMSSQLCDLIESNNSLQEICEGEDSYRRAYMISRLHQESNLSAFAFKHALFTQFIRLPAVYGFEDDYKSPWVLNSFVKQGLSNGEIIPRNGSTYVWLTHHQVLIDYLRELLVSFDQSNKDKNVSYLRPPSIGITVNNLSLLVMGIIAKNNTDDISLERIISKTIHSESLLKLNFTLLKSNIKELISKHSK